MLRTFSLIEPGLAGWRMAGPGGFREIGHRVIESWGGSGLFWYAAEAFADFVLTVDWRCTGVDDNSGVFVRIPPLDDGIAPAIEYGYEIQIDERGIDPEKGRAGDALHLTGSIYKLAPATARSSRAIGEWNRFQIAARGHRIAVELNGTRVSALGQANRNRTGHIALQNHHDGSAVQFRNLTVVRSE